MSEREEAALKCAQHIIKIKRTHSDYRDSWFGGESNLATEFMLLRQRVQTAERERDEARRERDAYKILSANNADVADALHHRAERAERVVKAAKAYREEWDSDGFEYVAHVALLDAIRALDAEAQP